MAKVLGVTKSRTQLSNFHFQPNLCVEKILKKKQDNEEHKIQNHDYLGVGQWRDQK